MGNNFDRDYDAGSPSEGEKQRIVALSFKCDDYRANSYQDLKMKYAFNKTVEICMYRLLRFMTPELKEKIKGIFEDMDKKIKEIDNSRLSEQKKNKEKIETEFDFFEEMHRINVQVLPHSSVEEQAVSGELDITDPEILKIIIGKKGNEIPAYFSE